jgi:hypothetical protein
MDKPQEITAKSTKPNENRFTEIIYVRPAKNGTIEILEYKKRRLATVQLRILIEYPTYETELEIRQKANIYDERNQIHYVDIPTVSLERIRHCLVRWDFHEKIPGLTKRLHRKTGILEDDSVDLWKKLPPNLRKYISYLIDIALGSV